MDIELENEQPEEFHKACDYNKVRGMKLAYG
jgi:hypothetical protein